jgi:cobalt-zinc-cadmium efflux system outer membrane protein
MFRCITVALVCVAAWALVSVASAEPKAPSRARAITLEQAVARALDTAPSLKSRQELVVAAEANVRQSGVLPNPSLDVELENFAGSDRFEAFEQSELTLGVRQRIERGGKVASRLSVASAEHQAAALESRRTRASVAFEARRVFIEVFAATAALSNAEARLKAASQIEAMAVRRVRSARDPVTVRLRAEIQTAEARTARDQASLDLRHAKRTLALMWGTSDEAFEIDGTPLWVMPPEVPKQVRASSAEVRAREIAASRAAARLALEQANARSDVSVGVGVRRFEDGGDLAGVLSVSVPIALFDDNQGNIDRAAAESRAAELDVADAKQRHAIELVGLEEEAARSRAALDMLRGELLPRAKSALGAARHGFNAGAFGYQEIAEAQRILAELNAREITLLRQLHLAHANLDRLAGRTGEPSQDQGTEP